MFKLHHRNLPDMFLALFQRNEQVHTFFTRNSKSLLYPYFSKTVTQQQARSQKFAMGGGCFGGLGAKPQALENFAFFCKITSF